MLRQVFEQARKEAQAKQRRWWEYVIPTLQERPRRPRSAILFIDELDALGKTRSTVNSNDEREQALNQLLVELDGFKRSDDDVTLVVMAASNRADVLDPAILRRFDRQVHVGLPDAQGRAAILKVHARHIRCRSDISWQTIASDELTHGLSGADIRNVINEAALLAIREHSKHVHQKHLEQAARRVSRMKWTGTRLDQL